MQIINVAELTPHPRNSEFFDDMEGSKWEEFLESVKTSGVIEPIVITDKKLIVSGHQRVRACKELGIETIVAEVKIYGDDEEKILKDLIETNIRQRGSIGGSEKKTARRCAFLQEYYGVKHGNNQHNEDFANAKSTRQKNHDELLGMTGMSKDDWNRSIQISKLSEPVQDLLDSGTINKSTALNIYKALSPEQQQGFVEAVSGEAKLSTKEADAYIEQIKGYEDKITSLEADVQAAEQRAREMEAEAVEATRAVKSSQDSDEYMRMKKKLEEANEARRIEYERVQSLKSEMSKKEAEHAAALEAERKKVYDTTLKASLKDDKAKELEIAQREMNRFKKMTQELQENISQANAERDAALKAIKEGKTFEEATDENEIHANNRRTAEAMGLVEYTEEEMAYKFSEELRCTLMEFNKSLVSFDSRMSHLYYLFPEENVEIISTEASTLFDKLNHITFEIKKNTSRTMEVV